jgi:1,4-alpha-glucan branching enzyme
MPPTQAPSPLPDVMGPFLQQGGCSFRVWAPEADAVELQLFWPDGNTGSFGLARDSAEGYGGGCWSAFVDGVVEETSYRYRITHAGRVFPRVDPLGRCVFYPHWAAGAGDDSEARTLITAQDFDWGPPFPPVGWREMIIYQLHVGTFVGGDGERGTMGGLKAQLDYLAGLGVNAIQLLPFTEYASRLSLGYNAVLPYAVEADYGRPADVKALVRAAHSRGLAVIVDVVFNHIFTDDGGRSLDYSLMDFDGSASPRQPCGIYFYSNDYGEMSTPWSAPRPDYSRPQVRRFLRDNALMWLEEYHVDGLRFDSTVCMRKKQGPCGDTCCGEDLGGGARNYGWELMREINWEISRRHPATITIAEDLQDNPALTSGSASGAGFDAQWEVALRVAVTRAVTQPDDAAVDLGPVAAALPGPPGTDPVSRVLYIESHDEAQGGRLPDRIDPGHADGYYARKKTMLATAVMVTSPGIPMIFQGHEVLDWDRWNDAQPFPWDHLQSFGRYHLFYADLIRLRRYLNGTTRGLCGAHARVLQCNDDGKVLVYQRWDRGGGADDVVVVASFSSQCYPAYRLGLPYDGTWQVRLNSDADDYSDSGDFGATPCDAVVSEAVPWDGLPQSGTVGLGPFAVVILGR